MVYGNSARFFFFFLNILEKSALIQLKMKDNKVYIQSWYRADTKISIFPFSLSLSLSLSLSIVRLLNKNQIWFQSGQYDLEMIYILTWKLIILIFFN